MHQAEQHQASGRDLECVPFQHLYPVLHTHTPYGILCRHTCKCTHRLNAANMSQALMSCQHTPAAAPAEPPGLQPPPAWLLPAVLPWVQPAPAS
jgi:hypothetical protein